MLNIVEFAARILEEARHKQLFPRLEQLLCRGRQAVIATTETTHLDKMNQKHVSRGQTLTERNSHAFGKKDTHKIVDASVFRLDGNRRERNGIQSLQGVISTAKTTHLRMGNKCLVLELNRHRRTPYPNLHY